MPSLLQALPLVGWPAVCTLAWAIGQRLGRIEGAIRDLRENNGRIEGRLETLATNHLAHLEAALRELHAEVRRDRTDD